MRVGPLNPRRWNVRARSAVAAALVVIFCLVLAGGAMVFVLYRALGQSARDAADARAQQIATQLQNASPTSLDPGLLATDDQVGVIQVLGSDRSIVVESAGAAQSPLAAPLPEPGEVKSVGRVKDRQGGDYWIVAHSAGPTAAPWTVLVGADREPVERVVATVALLLAAGGPIVVALVALATYRLVGAALEPVEQIRTRVSSISSGKLDERVPVPGTHDEIARLAETMNDMLARLEHGSVTQRRFVSDASHELRSPLATITAALELAHSKPELIDTALVDDTLLPEARRMRDLLEDLLTLARADEQGLTATATDVDLDDILFAEAARCRALPGISVRTQIAPTRVHGDPRQLARMVRNLVDNAVRHAHNEIRLECRSHEGSAVITVQDDGPGVPEAQRARIFERFVRLDSPRTRDGGGTGLGLAIVAEIVAVHHGTVAVTEPDGGGARFVVSLPADGEDQTSDSRQ
ncbi:sensor histidine kinase [Prescottella agglutinans]|uniref:histidine kinase n=1 Tax=Prescottella agglutinans TaxID=1644129 RepID=A0ABT6MJ95_9NOCA|nr:ATP-binding protein [Prescottella agglutinans]MDH6284396.1 signal transduction histidine kinase [Prescottella agglutinans]